MDIIIAWITVIVLLVIMYIFLISTIKDCAETVIFARERKKMFCALENTLLSYDHDNDTAICFRKIDLIFKHIINKNEDLKRNYAGMNILLEKYLIALNSKNTKIVNPNVSDINV